MVIEGVNLFRAKRAFVAYLEFCMHSVKTAEKSHVKDYWDPEIKAAEEMIKAIEQNIKTENTVRE